MGSTFSMHAAPTKKQSPALRWLRHAAVVAPTRVSVIFDVGGRCFRKNTPADFFSVRILVISQCLRCYTGAAAAAAAKGHTINNT